MTLALHSPAQKQVDGGAIERRIGALAAQAVKDVESLKCLAAALGESVHARDAERIADRIRALGLRLQRDAGRRG